MFADGVGGLGVYGKVTSEIAAQMDNQIASLWKHTAES
jgi:hypothetical protein